MGHYEGPIISRETARGAGLGRYFQATKCKHGHVAQRFVSNCGCVQCATDRRNTPEGKMKNRAKVHAWKIAHPEIKRASDKRWRDNNPERSRENVRRWCDENHDRHREKSRLWRERNSDDIKVKKAAWYNDNRERILAKQAERNASNPTPNRQRVEKWKIENPEKHRETKLKYYTSNPERHSVFRQNRRSRMRNAEGSFTEEDIAVILTTQDYSCAACSTEITTTPKQPNTMHVDHIRPLALGGSNWPENLQVLCPACNKSKGAKDPVQWARERGLQQILKKLGVA